MNKKYKKTVTACFVGSITQAIINNFIPLLFLTFQQSYKIPLEKITLLVTINFLVQLIVDLLAIRFVDKIGYRPSIVAAHVFAAVGLVLLTILPEVFLDPFNGLLVSIMFYAVGGGLIEVLVSPIVEATPSDNKEKMMSLLHSFYCWGHVAVVILSTLFFFIFGIKNWRILALLWAIVPIINTFAFATVPIAPLLPQGEKGNTVKELFSKRIFWVFILIMICAGASEQSISQWASTFAEKGLNVNKTIGDLAGPMIFAISMGLSRVFFAKSGEKINLNKFILSSSVLCIISYLVISLTTLPILGFLGVALSGLSVGIMWPGTFSIASAKIKRGGTAMFAILALAGDLGCSLGPTIVGITSSRFNDNLRVGIFFAIVFPIILFVSVLGIRNKNTNTK